MKQDIDQEVKKKMQGSASRVRRRVAPTFGAVVLFLLLATWVGYNAVDSARDIERTAIEARIDACERGNIIRESQRESNFVLLKILTSAAGTRDGEVADARNDLIQYLQQNPNDPVARYIIAATEGDPISKRAIDQAKIVLERQSELMKPIDCAALEGSKNG